jgi:hypothetical protein
MEVAGFLSVLLWMCLRQGCGSGSVLDPDSVDFPSATVELWIYLYIAKIRIRFSHQFEETMGLNRDLPEIVIYVDSNFEGSRLSVYGNIEKIKIGTIEKERVCLS